MSMTTVSQAQVLRYMHSIEAFNPPAIDDIKEAPRVLTPDTVFTADYRVGMPLPWHSDHATAHCPLGKTSRSSDPEDDDLVDNVWRHMVYLGVFPRACITQLLDRLTRARLTVRDEAERRTKINLTQDTAVSTLNCCGRLRSDGPSSARH